MSCIDISHFSKRVCSDVTDILLFAELEDINNKHIYDSVDEIQDEERPPPANVEKTFNIEKEIKHAIIVECDENPYYEEFDVSLRNYKHLRISF